MIADLRPYAEYKESGFPWLGVVPEHWEIKRAKSIFQRIDERSTTGKEELLTVSSARGIVPRKTANVTMFKAESYLGYKLCWPGDLVINSLWAWAGGLGVSRYHGIISSAYGVYRIRPDAPMIPEFVHEVVRSSSFNWELRVRSKGVWISRLQLTDISFLDAPMYILPPDEQAAIVRFLDWANGRLDRAIRAKRKVIALLNEQKQAIIHRAVTRGLDPSVPLKSSGIPWFGDIPLHWEVLRGKYLGRLFSTPSVLDHELTEDGIGNLMYLKVSDLAGVDDSFKLTRSRLYVRRLAARRETRRSFLVFPKRGGAIYTNRVAILELPCLLDPNLMGWEISARFDPHYVALLLKTRTLADLADVSSVPQINNHHINPIPFPSPPVEEQRAIVVELRKSLVGVNTAISRLEREIELLREYRTRLVADVVTGKLDVRKAAVRLPEEAPPDTVEDEMGLTDDPETADEGVVA